MYDWTNLCHIILVAVFEKKKENGGYKIPNTIVQVDESLMRGKRKYNR